MVNIVETTIRANIFETLYDSLTASLSAGTVTAAFIDDNPTFPQVVINPTKLLIKKLTLNRGTKEYTCEVEIEIYAKKNKDIDEIADEIHADLSTNEATIKAFGLYINDIEDSNSDTFFWNDQKIHTKTLLLTAQVNI
jgi:hypothetical protein